MTQAKLAAALDVTPLTVHRWETGQRGLPGYLHLALDSLVLDYSAV